MKTEKSRMRKMKLHSDGFWCVVLINSLLAGGLALLLSMPLIAQEIGSSGIAPKEEMQELDDAADAQVLSTESGTIAPDPPEAAEVPPAELSPAEKEALLRRLHNMREMREPSADELGGDSESEPEGESPAGPETHVDDFEGAEFHGNPAAFRIGRNRRNTQADNPGNSTLAEPAAANNARLAFAAGNFDHAEFSSNGGATWTNVPLPGGPGDAPFLCCDHDVVIDDARRVTFHSALYLNNAGTDGAVRIFVRRQLPTASCSYTFRTGGTSVPDYPHLGLSKRFLYLTINALGLNGGFARIFRFNIDQMSNCAAISFRFFTQSHNIPVGQKVWVPAESTNNGKTMFWGQLENSTPSINTRANRFRIFQWRESSNSVQAFLRIISTSNFVNGSVDCRGGVGNRNWRRRSTANSSQGFRLRGAAAPGAWIRGSGALAFYWNVARDQAHTQGHIHAAVFRLHDLRLIAQPHIFNNSFCFGFPSVTANKRGDIGITLAWGGRRGGGGSAAQAGVGLDDEFTAGIGRFGTLFRTARGTHNRNDGRFGDYFTIHPYEPCEKWFTATNYALLNGRNVANVNSRYVEFGRNQSFSCYRANRNSFPVQNPR